MPAHIPSPTHGGIRIDKDSRLWVQTWTVEPSLTIQFCARTLLLNNETTPIWYTWKLDDGGTEQSFFIHPSPGLLESANIYITAGSSQFGDIYVQMSMIRGKETQNVAHRLIIQGYIGGANMRGYPGSDFDPP